ncbi:MAG: tetratricopeptide repeat protein [Treponema sp.]|nr:tetratricopeptide repeat protein [Candidatus Treponema merdequi]
MIEHAETLNTQAISLAQNGDYKEAIACFKRAIVVEKQNYLLWFNLGVTYRDAGEFQSAKECLLKAFDLNETDRDIIESIALINLSLKDFEEAVAFCWTGLDYYPTDSRLWNTLGVIFFNQSDYINAADAFERAITINPYYYDALFNLRDTYDELGNKTGKALCIQKMKEIKHSDCN